MQLTTSPQRHNQVTTLDERHLRVLAKYGEPTQMIMRFAPRNLARIARDIDKSVDAAVPPVVHMLQSYGEADMIALLSLHIDAIMVYNGIDQNRIDDSMVHDIASTMLQNDNFRTLNIAFALCFFQELKKGSYELYGHRPANFMNALREYCRTAHDQQAKLYDRKERREKEAAWQQHLKESVTWEKYCAMRGLDPTKNINPLNFPQQ